jgi:uncharacterized ParB-like nuclease family protein
MERKATPNILDDLMSSQPAGATKPAASPLRIAEIRRDGGTQPRAGLDETHVADLVAALANGDELPPVDVIFDGSAYWLYDGFHRVEATSRSGQYTVQAIIHQGTQADAQWQSYAANSRHGLKRTNDDKRRQVIAALKHPTGASISNREIARHVGVDEGTVRGYREKMEVTAEIPQSTERTGADGRVYQTVNIGKARPTPKRDDAAEDAWRPAQETPATLPPLKRAGESDVYAVLDIMSPTCDIETVDPAWRLDYVESALLRADKAMRRDLIVDCIDDWLRNRKLRHGIEDAPAADPYHHADGDAIRNDLAVQDAARIATADVAFGMATDKGAAQYARLLEAVADALPEIAKLTGKTIDVSVLKAALRPVHDALINMAVAPPPAAPAAALPADLVAHGWELHTMRGKHYASVSVPTEDVPIRTQLRADIGDAIRDAQYLHKNLQIGVSA